MAYAKPIEAVGRKLRIITQVSEELAARAFVAREAFLQIALIDQVVDFAVERVGDEAFSENATEEILLVACGEHKRGGNRGGVVDEIHLAWREVSVCLWVGAGADGDEQHLLFTGGPAEIVRFDGGHEEELKGGVVVHR